MQPVLTALVVAVFAAVLIAKSLKTIPEAHEGVVERLGKFLRTLPPGLSIIVPFVDKVRFVVDKREQVKTVPLQEVATKDDKTVAIDAVIAFEVTDVVRASYEVADYPSALAQLADITLRNIVSDMDREHALASRGVILRELEVVLGPHAGDEDDGDEDDLDWGPSGWGLKINRVELNRIDRR